MYSIERIERQERIKKLEYLIPKLKNNKKNTTS
jgi:hypothetical protein